MPFPRHQVAEDAPRRLGGTIAVGAGGSQVFLHAGTEPAAREAARVRVRPDARTGPGRPHARCGLAAAGLDRQRQPVGAENRVTRLDLTSQC